MSRLLLTFLILLSFWSCKKNIATSPVNIKAEIISNRDSILWGDTCTFTANENQDCRYFWDFGDKSTAEGRVVSHLYNQPGQYSVKLTVTNIENKSSETKTTIQVGTRYLTYISSNYCKTDTTYGGSYYVFNITPEYNKIETRFTTFYLHNLKVNNSSKYYLGIDYRENVDLNGHHENTDGCSSYFIPGNLSGDDIIPCKFIYNNGCEFHLHSKIVW